MNIFSVSYAADAPQGLPCTVLAHHYDAAADNDVAEFRVDRPAGSSSELSTITVLRLPRHWVLNVQLVGVVGDLPPAR